MMDFPFSSQQPAIRFWAVTSSMVLGLLVVLAGASLMLASTLREVHGEIWTYPITRTLGLGSVSFVWLAYMASLIVLLGYEDTTRRRSLVFLTFLASSAFLWFVLWNIGLPFHFNGTASMM
ncbi:MAG: hypothetical protein AAGE65_09595 [Planctomycetota bacterium]